MNTTAQPEQKRATVLLAIGALLGLALAAASLIESRDDAATLGKTVVARVNEAPIHRADFERLVAGLESDTRQPADSSTRRRVLDRMIEEELLVQRGLDLGLASVDRKVRSDLVSAVIVAVAGDAEEREPSETELAAFHRENADFFTQPGRLHVRQIFVRAAGSETDDAARDRADRAAARLRAGEEFAIVRAELGTAEILEIPDAPLPAAKLREYVGPTALRAAASLEAGQVGDPVRSGTGYHVIQMLRRDPDHTPELSQITKQVRAEWLRRAGDRALREYLDDLRAAADVSVTPDLE